MSYFCSWADYYTVVLAPVLFYICRIIIITTPT